MELYRKIFLLCLCLALCFGCSHRIRPEENYAQYETFLQKYEVAAGVHAEGKADKDSTSGSRDSGRVAQESKQSVLSSDANSRQLTAERATAQKKSKQEQDLAAYTIRDVSKIHSGDIIAFRQPGSASGYQKAIYLGGGRFIYAPQEKSRARIASLNSQFFQENFIGARCVDASKKGYDASLMALAQSYALHNNKQGGIQKKQSKLRSRASAQPSKEYKKKAKRGKHSLFAKNKKKSRQYGQASSKKSSKHWKKRNAKRKSMYAGKRGHSYHASKLSRKSAKREYRNRAYRASRRQLKAGSPSVKRAKREGRTPRVSSRPQRQFGCSGTVHWKYKGTGLHLPRSPKGQSSTGDTASDKSSPNTGNVITFRVVTSKDGDARFDKANATQKNNK